MLRSLSCLRNKPAIDFSSTTTGISRLGNLSAKFRAGYCSKGDLYLATEYNSN